jgi:mono/diheme cytochrome c family protein
MKPIFSLALLLLMGSTMSLRAAGVRANWDANCVPCHGKEGKADTTMGKALKAKDFSDPAAQASFTDAKAIESIKNGIKENGKTKMTPFVDKLTDDEIKALVAYVRTLKK